MHAYKVELPGKYGISVTFNIPTLFFIYIYTGDDLRANPFEERRNDVILASILKDPL
jgi:hypothetical protein